MKVKTSDRSLVAILLFILGATIFMVVVLAPRAYGWSTIQAASAACVGGEVKVNATFTNIEPANSGLTMIVTATVNGQMMTPNSVTVQPGETVNFFAVTAEKTGEVVFDLSWADGRDGLDARSVSYDASNLDCKEVEIISIPAEPEPEVSTPAPSVLAVQVQAPAPVAEIPVPERPAVKHTL